MLHISDLGVLLVILLAGALLASRLGLSAIPIYIGAGIIFGPNEPHEIVLISSSEAISLLAQLGVVLLLFFLGLEFSFERISQARHLIALGGGVDLALNGAVGLAVGVLLAGWGVEAVLIAGLLYVSSSGIITRALFDLRRLADDETDLVLGILVFEDIAIAVFLAVTAALVGGGATSAGDIVLTVAVVLAFVGVFVVLSRLAPRVLDRVTPSLSREQLLLGSLAVAVGSAGLAEAAGLSEAIGALLAGVLLSGSAVRDEIERQLLGLRDFSAAIFFFAFGLSVDLGQADRVWLWLLAAVPVGIAAKIAGGYLAGRVTGFSRRRSLDAGAALVARGEFSIILAQLAVGGAALDAGFRGRVEPFAGLMVVVTAAVGVLLMRESRRVGRALFPLRQAPGRPATKGEP
jgi:monovalent cation:H+ antiporter-2, CPA2 family